MNYLEKNLDYWKGIYNAPNVESFIFRFYGRILKFDYGIDGSNHEKLFDFGCGQGAALCFFDKLGFNVFGADIAENDLNVARKLLPHRANQIILVDPKPSEDLRLFPQLKLDEGDGFDIVISIQTLDFLSNSDLKKPLNAYTNI